MPDPETNQKTPWWLAEVKKEGEEEEREQDKVETGEGERRRSRRNFLVVAVICFQKQVRLSSSLSGRCLSGLWWTTAPYWTPPAPVPRLVWLSGEVIYCRWSTAPTHSGGRPGNSLTSLPVPALSLLLADSRGHTQKHAHTHTHTNQPISLYIDQNDALSLFPFPSLSVCACVYVLPQ